MKRRTLLQVLSAVTASLFVGVGQAVKAPLLPAIRTFKRGISAMRFVKFLDRPEQRADGAYVVATMVNASNPGPSRLVRPIPSGPGTWFDAQTQDALLRPKDDGVLTRHLNS